MTQQIGEMIYQCDAPNINQFQTKFEATICKPKFISLPIQIPVLLYIVTVIETNYWSDGITGWVTGTSRKPCSNPDICVRGIKMFPDGGVEEIPSAYQAFDRSYLWKVQQGRTRRTFSVTKSSGLVSSFEKDVWIDEFTTNLFDNWKTFIDQDTVYYFQHSEKDTKMLLVKTGIIKPNCNPCSDLNCASKKILECEEIGTVKYNTDSEQPLDKLINKEFQFSSVSDADYLFNRNETHFAKIADACGSRVIYELRKKKSTWYLTDLRSIRSKRDIASIWGSLNSLQEKVTKGFNLLANTSLDNEHKLSAIIEGLTNALDMNLKYIVDSINYASCLEKNRNYKLAKNLIGTDPKTALILVNSTLIPDAVEIITTTNDYISYKTCGIVKVECDKFDPFDLIQGGFCSGIVCQRKEGSSKNIYQINGRLFENKITVPCDHGTFWLTENKKYRLDSQGSVIVTSMTDIYRKLELINITQSSISLRDNIETMKASEAYSGMKAAKEKAARAISEVMGQNAENIFTAFADFSTSPWGILGFNISQILVFLVLLITIITVIYNWCKIRTLS